MGEAGLSARSASEIERSSILALRVAEARWRMRAVWVLLLNNNKDFYIYFAKLAHATCPVWSACKGNVLIVNVLLI